MKSKQWHPRVICADCGISHQAPFEHFLPEMCSACGAVRDDRWRLVRMRWVSTASWWRPSTWWRGYWEIAEESLPDGFTIHDGERHKPSRRRRLPGRIMDRFSRRGRKS